MPSLLACKYDREKEQDGVWFTTEEGWKLKIARIGNRKYKQAIRKVAIDNQRSIKKDKSGELILGLSKEAAAEYILLDWKDLLEDDEKTVMPYSSKRALEIFNEYDEFYELALEYASREDEYRAELVEEAVKN
jgi:hypothetical protein